MIGLAISILWFALGVLILGCIVYVALWAVKKVVPVPPVVEQVVWAIFIILVLIYLLMTINGTAPGGRPFRWGGVPASAHSAWATVDLSRLLT